MQLAGGDARVDHEQSLGLALRVHASQRESVLAYSCVCAGIFLVMAMCVCNPVRESPNELILYVFRKFFCRPVIPTISTECVFTVSTGSHATTSSFSELVMT